ncbi:MAG: S24 family peptidase [Minwuia sp.]|nr:S24 family peptidase [Minwuia sp.]
MTTKPKSPDPAVPDPGAHHIRAWRRRAGLKQTALAEAISRDIAVISRIENHQQEPSEQMLASIAARIGVTPADLLRPPPADGAPPRKSRPALTPSTGRPAPDAPPIPPRSSMPLDLPLLGTAAGSFNGEFILQETVDYVRRPPALAGTAQAYAIEVTGDSMAPRFEEGDLVFVHPGRRVLVGDDIILQTRNGEHDELQTFIKRFVRQDADTVTVRQFNPPQDITWERRFVVAMHRVMSLRDCFGI